MKTQPLAQLNLAGKPWFPNPLKAEQLAQTLTSATTRENWKHTPIRAFVEAYVEHCTNAPASTPQVYGAGQSGVTVTPLHELSKDDLQLTQALLTRLDGVRYPLAGPTTLNNESGQLIKVSHSLSEPLHIHHVEPQQLLLIDVANEASVSIVETSEQVNFGNTITVINLAPQSQVEHARSALQASTMHLSLLGVTVAQNAAYKLQQYLVGGNKRRADCHIVLAGPNASASVTGAFVTEDGHHLDQQLVVEHAAPHTLSSQTIHGIGMGKSRSIFNGRIHIHPGANGADAQLSNKNISLDAGADINTKPELEIYTDDVKCAHGATVGQLDSEQLFYLRSRGLSEPEAKSILCTAFIRACIEGTLTEPVTKRLMECLA